MSGWAFLPVGAICFGFGFFFGLPNPPPQPVLVTLDASQWVCTKPGGSFDGEGRLTCDQFTAKGVKP